MARVIGKLKSAMKRLPSLTKSNRSRSKGSSSGDDVVLREVYVGKSRRRYMVTQDVVGHPLFRQLAVEDDDAVLVADCEVVMFEHLMWMIHSDADLVGPTDELVQYYTTR